MNFSFQTTKDMSIVSRCGEQEAEKKTRRDSKLEYENPKIGIRKLYHPPFLLIGDRFTQLDNGQVGIGRGAP